MAIDNKKLRNLFGNGPDTDSKNSSSYFDESEDDYPTNDYAFEAPDYEDDLLPAANVIKNPDATAPTEQSFNSDMDYVLRALEDSVNSAQQLVKISVNNAKDGNARDVETAATAIATLAANADKITDTYLKMYKIKQMISSEMQPNVGTGNTFVQNQVVVQTSTSDALKAIREGTIDVNNL